MVIHISIIKNVMPPKPTPADIMGIANIPPPMAVPATINMLPSILLFTIEFILCLLSV